MYRLTCFLIIVCIVIALSVNKVFANSDKPINVFVSILPQKYLVKRIGGDRVNVSVMVRPGLSPETYEPTPKQMAVLGETQLYFRIAVPFETIWIKRIEDINPRMKIIDCCGDLKVTDYAHNPHGDRSDTSFENDAHIWTSPKIAIVLAGIIKTSLSEYDPGSAGYYSDNYDHLINDLNSLDGFIRNELIDIRIPYFIVSHPSWGHFAKTYGLEQISIEQHGSEIRAKELSRLIEFARKWNIDTVYVQKQFNTVSAKTLAHEINGRIVELDPLAEDYINNMRYVARMIAEGAGKK